MVYLQWQLGIIVPWLSLKSLGNFENNSENCLKIKAFKYIDYLDNSKYDDEGLYKRYGVQYLTPRWREHMACLMYTLSKDSDKINVKRP